MERAIGSKKWKDRLAHTLLGMIMVDAFLMYSNDPIGHDNNHPTLAFIDFVNRVSHSILVQKVLEVHTINQRPLAAIDEDEDDEDEEEHEEVTDTCYQMPISILFPISSSNRRRKQVTRTCTNCQKQTSYCCGRCSDVNKVVAVCTYRAVRSVPCFVAHCRLQRQDQSDGMTE